MKLPFEIMHILRLLDEARWDLEDPEINRDGKYSLWETIEGLQDMLEHEVRKLARGEHES